MLLPLALLHAAIWIAFEQQKPDFLLHASFYDVGQGDAIFFKTYLGNKVLIDGGPSDAVLQGLGEDLAFFDRDIDLLILTHPHADHVSGLVDVIRRFRVKMVLLPEVEFDSPAFRAFLAEIEKQKVQKIYARQGQRVFLDSATVFDVYYPQGKISGADFSEGFSSVSSSRLNDASVVGKLSFGGTQVMLTGDAGRTIENYLLAGFALQSDILKVGHHGSRFSTSPGFVEEVAPEFAIIQVGQNTYGHPTEETLNVLSARNIKIFRTDRDGTVRFLSDGAHLYPVRNPMH